MNRWPRRVLALAWAGIFGTGCGVGHEEAAPPSPRNADVVVLDPAQAARLDMETAQVVEAPDEVDALGRVLDPVPLLQAWAAFSSARSDQDIAERDLARVRKLAVHSENASARDLEAAELAAARARSALVLARAQIVGIWGTVEPDAIEHWAAALQRGTAAIARIELPADEEIRPLPKAVHLSIPGLGMSERPARLIGSAGSVDPTLQGRALLVALTSDPPPAGASVLAQVELEGIVERGVFLPPSAVVWNEGQPLAFVATDPNHFVRRRLHLARSLAQGFLATQGVSAGERFVRTGAQQLLSSQLLGSAIEE